MVWSCEFGMLYVFQVDIFAQLQNASEAFRTYIRDGLAQVLYHDCYCSKTFQVVLLTLNTCRHAIGDSY